MSALLRNMRRAHVATGVPANDPAIQASSIIRQLPVVTSHQTLKPMKNLAFHLGHYITSAFWPWLLAPRSSTFGEPAVTRHKPCARSAIGVLFAGGLALALAGARAWGKQYAIDGGFEAVTTNPVVNATGDANRWTTGDSIIYAFCITDTTTPKTGGKCMKVQTGSNSNHKLQTKQTLFSSTTHIVVQYYYKDESSQAPGASLTAGIEYGGKQIDGTDPGRAAHWTKMTDILSVSGTPASTDFAYFNVKRSGMTGVAVYYIDDVAVYDGTAIDDTPPDAPTSPSVAAASSTSSAVSWTAPTTGVDGSGY